MSDETVAEWFEAYRRIAMAPDAPPLQISECEAAFHAGAWSMLNIFKQIGTPEVSEDDGVENLERLNAELNAFAARKAAEAIEHQTPTPVHEQSGFNVRQQEIENLLRALGRDIKGRMPPNWGFTLLISSFGKQGLKGEGEPGALFYLSSVEREGAIEMLKEFIRMNTQ